MKYENYIPSIRLTQKTYASSSAENYQKYSAILAYRRRQNQNENKKRKNETVHIYDTQVTK